MIDDAAALDAVLSVWGIPATVTPMAAADGPNAPRVPDPSRPVKAINVIRSEASQRLALSDNGVGRPAGQFRMGTSSQQHLVTMRLEEGPFLQGDQLVYGDRPTVYRLGEPKPDGGAGIHFVVNRA
jgi:hypothetical protein